VPGHAHRDVEQARNLLLEYVATLTRTDPERAQSFVDRLGRRFEHILKGA